MTERLLLRRSPLSRRSILRGAAGATLFAAAPAIIGPAIAAEENVVFVNTYGGSWTAAEVAAYYEPFTKETGIQVRTVTPVSTAKIKAQVVTGNYDWDVGSIGASEFEQVRVAGLLEPIDRSIVNLDKIQKRNIFGDNGINSVSLSYLYAYRKDKFPNGGPKTWADFWDVKKFPGNRSMASRSWTCVAHALLADGVPLDKLYPLDIERAFKKLDEIKPHIKVWWKENTQSQQLVRDGEVDLIQMTNARAQELIDQGIPLEIVWNGAESYESPWFVSKGAPRAKAGWKLIDFCSRPEPQAEFCRRLPYGPSNPDAFKFLDEKSAAKLPTTPEHLAQSFTPDAAWLGPRLDALKERWVQWIGS